MPDDPDDLLIFKRRGMNAELPSPPEEKLISAPGQHAIEPAVQKREPQPQSKQQEVAVNSAGMQQVQTEQIEEFKPPQKPSSKGKEGAGMEEQQPANVSKSARENMRAARGRACVNHQWRSAYALCSYCRRPFCYADLLTYEKNFYCLEDIDRVSMGSVSVTYSRNVLTMAAATMLVVNALIVAYFTMPGIQLLVGAFGSGIAKANILPFNYSTTVGNVRNIYGVTTSTVATYIFQTLYFSAVALLLISGISTAAFKRGFYIAILVCIFTLLAFSYEYLITSYNYALIFVTIAFIEIAMLAYSRMSSVTFSPIASISQKYVDWPRPEVF